MSKNNFDNMGFGTRAIHAGRQENMHGASTEPIYQTSSYIFKDAKQGGDRFAGTEAGHVYSRISNPTLTVIEDKIASLEGAEAGLATASGMGAITSAIWSIVGAGDHIVTAKTLYGCTFALLKDALQRLNIEVSFVDPTDLDEFRAAMQENTKLVYIETPVNPNLVLTDIEEVAKIAHNVEGCLLMVDNTFATPYLQRPIELGADLVIHSATKYLNGHGDVIAGLTAGPAELINEIRTVGLKDMTGAVLSPFDAFLIARGMKTLEIRMDRHCDNAEKVAKFLDDHPKVESVNFPGLKSFPQYDIAQKQMDRPGAMISFELKGGIAEGETVMNNLKVCKLAVSLGDTETLICHPASMTHSPYPKDERLAAGISDGLVRLSVGIENVEDIIEDLNQALNLI